LGFAQTHPLFEKSGAKTFMRNYVSLMNFDNYWLYFSPLESLRFPRSPTAATAVGFLSETIVSHKSSLLLSFKKEVRFGLKAQGFKKSGLGGAQGLKNF